MSILCTGPIAQATTVTRRHLSWLYEGAMKLWEGAMKLCVVVLAYFPLALCAVNKFELGDFTNVHKLQYDAATPGPKEMSKEEIHKELHSLRQQRSSGQPVNYRYVFHDVHSNGVIQYSGTDQQVIFVLTYNPNSNGIPVTGTNLYKSINYGKISVTSTNDWNQQGLCGCGTISLSVQKIIIRLCFPMPLTQRCMSPRMKAAHLKL